MLDKLKRKFFRTEKPSVSTSEISEIQNTSHGKLALVLAFLLAACKFDTGGFAPEVDANNNNNNNQDAAVDARPLNDGSLDSAVDAAPTDAAQLDSSLPDASYNDTGIQDAYVADGTVQNDSGPTVENCTNGIDDDSDGMIDCWDPDCSSTADCTGENCQTVADDENDGAPKCMDWECSTTAACLIWHSDCSLQGLNPGEDCATGGMGQCADGTCSQKSAATPSNCQPKNSACY